MSETLCDPIECTRHLPVTEGINEFPKAVGTNQYRTDLERSEKEHTF